jgi:hypothetical protein
MNAWSLARSLANQTRKKQDFCVANVCPTTRAMLTPFILTQIGNASPLCAKVP